MQEVLPAYALATFCLQPPGDSIARAAIIDSMAMGCIPVFLHLHQARLWPWHWTGSDASLTFDWNTALGAPPARRADVLIDRLRAVPVATVRRMQDAGAAAVQALTYRGEATDRLACRSDGESADAIDILVEGLLRNRTIPHIPVLLADGTET